MPYRVMCHSSITSLEAKAPIRSFLLQQADSGLYSPSSRVLARDTAEFPV